MTILEQLKDLLRQFDKNSSVRVHLVFSMKDNSIVDVTRLNPMLSDPNYVLVETEFQAPPNASKRTLEMLYNSLLLLCERKADAVSKKRLQILDEWAGKKN